MAPPATAATISSSRSLLCSGNASSAACKRVRFSSGLNLVFESVISRATSALTASFAGSLEAVAAATAAFGRTPELAAGPRRVSVGGERVQAKSNALALATRHQRWVLSVIALCAAG